MQHHGAALRRVSRNPELAQAVAGDWRKAGLDDRWTAILEYAERLTLEPSTVREIHLTRLREVGLGDGAILHVCEIVAYFNFVNRLADGLGVALEDGWQEPIMGRFSRPAGGEDR